MIRTGRRLIDYKEEQRPEAEEEWPIIPTRRILQLKPVRSLEKSIINDARSKVVEHKCGCVVCRRASDV